jgi:lipoprotein LprG
MGTTRKLATAVLAGLCLLGTAACTGGSPAPGSTQQAELTPAQRLEAAKGVLDAATSIHLTLTSADVPKGSTGVVSGDGVGTHPPAFKGTFKITVTGVPADAEITSVGGEVWATLPFVPGTNKIDPAQFGLPDPASFLSPDKGITSLLPATVDPVKGDPVRLGSEVLTRISGSLPGSAVVDLLRIGDRNGTFTVSYGLTDANQLRQVAIAGPFFGAGTSSTYTLVLDRYGEPVTISKPA